MIVGAEGSQTDTLAADIHAFNLDVITHWIIAGWGVWYFAFVLGMRWHSALLAGWMGCLAGALLVLPVNIPLLRVAVYTGWALALITMLLRTSQKRYALGLIAVWALALLAGGPQMVAMLWLASLVYALLAGYEMHYNKVAYKGVGWLVLTPFVAAGIAAVQILPTWLHLPHTGISTHEGSEALSFSASWLQMTTFMLPPTWAMRLPPEHPLPSYYPMGLWCTALGGGACLAAMFFRRVPMRLKGFFGVMVLFALGGNTFVYPLLLKVLPFFAIFRAPDRFLAIAVVPLCVLAAFAIDQIFLQQEDEPEEEIDDEEEEPAAPPPRPAWLVLAACYALVSIGGFIIVGTVINIWQVTNIGPAETWAEYFKAGGVDFILQLGIIGIVLAMTHRAFAHKIGPSTVAAVAIALTFAHQWILTPAIAPLKTLPMHAMVVQPTLAAMINEQVNTDQAEFWARTHVVSRIAMGAEVFPEYQVATTGGSISTDILSWYHGAGTLEQQELLLMQCHPNSGNLWGLQYADGIASLYSDRADEFLRQMADAQIPGILNAGRRPPVTTLYDLAGIGYLVLPDPVPEEIFPSVDVDGLTFAYNPRTRTASGDIVGPKSMAWVHRPSRIVAESEEALIAMIELRLDPNQTLILDWDAGELTGEPSAAPINEPEWQWITPAISRRQSMPQQMTG